MLNLIAKAAIGVAVLAVGAFVVKKTVITKKTYTTVNGEVVENEETVEEPKTIKEKVQEKLVKVAEWTVNNMDKIQIATSILSGAAMIFEIAYEAYSWKSMSTMKKDIEFLKDMSVTNAHALSSHHLLTSEMIAIPEARQRFVDNLPEIESLHYNIENICTDYFKEKGAH